MSEFLVKKLKEDRPHKLDNQSSGLLQASTPQKSSANSLQKQLTLAPKSSSRLEDDANLMLVKTGIVVKKKGVIKNIRRKLTLTNQPRLYFSTADTGEYKSDILITPFVAASYHGGDRFEIYCKKSGKRYMLKVENG